MSSCNRDKSCIRGGSTTFCEKRRWFAQQNGCRSWSGIELDRDAKLRSEVKFIISYSSEKTGGDKARGEISANVFDPVVGRRSHLAELLGKTGAKAPKHASGTRIIRTAEKKGRNRIFSYPAGTFAPIGFFMRSIRAPRISAPFYTGNFLLRDKYVRTEIDTASLRPGISSYLQTCRASASIWGKNLSAPFSDSAAGRAGAN